MTYPTSDAERAAYNRYRPTVVAREVLRAEGRVWRYSIEIGGEIAESFLTHVGTLEILARYGVGWVDGRDLMADARLQVLAQQVTR